MLPYQHDFPFYRWRPRASFAAGTSTLYLFFVLFVLFSFRLFLFMLVSWDGCDKISLVVIFLSFSFFLFFNLTYSRWTSSLPSCLWSLRIVSSLPGSRLTIFYRDASSALLQLVNQWLNFTYSRSHAFRYGRKNTNPTLVRIELTTSALAGVQFTY